MSALLRLVRAGEASTRGRTLANSAADSSVRVAPCTTTTTTFTTGPLHLGSHALTDMCSSLLVLHTQALLRIATNMHKEWKTG